MSETAPLEFTATDSLADVVAADAAIQPARKGRRRRLRPFIILGGLLVGLAAGLSGDGDPMATVKTLIQPRMGLFFVVSLIVIVAFIVLVRRGVRLVVRTARRATYADYRRHHPAVDPRDPALRMTRVYRFDATGMTAKTACDEIWESWARITGFDETPNLLIVRVGGTLGFPLPKAQLSADVSGRLRQYVNARSTSKWPF